VSVFVHLCFAWNCVHYVKVLNRNVKNKTKKKHMKYLQFPFVHMYVH